ncbi:MAG: exodeoxyribonuclease VII large subunit [Kiritimatiellae bacterium]|jgi:exodeoxyribonuclease VII large subunit|nr:exodeoxyribonuclease VII large subunit [Kiritimatiellia bacterium]
MEKRIYTVVEITKLITISLERSFSSICVEGELSDCVVHGSGHCYFTLKDGSEAQLRGVMFRTNCSLLDFVPANGMRVRVAGKISVYAPSGAYQIVAHQMEDVGKGDLHRLYEELKQKFQNEGLFDEQHKQIIPVLPERVGVVTSPSSAALRDILNVLGRRFENMPVIIAPVKVQGATSARQVAGAIKYLNDNNLCDVIIVSRGGGSFEDLWSFSDEVVVRAVFDSKLPVISAVGHNIDYPLCDFAADLRVPTPSAAAEMVVAPKDNFVQSLENMDERINMLLKGVTDLYRSRLDSIKSNYVFHKPRNLIDRYMQQLDGLDVSMTGALQGVLGKNQKNFESYKFRLSGCANRMVQKQNGVLVGCENRLCNSLSSCVERKKSELAVVVGKLDAFNPFGVLQRGYSITTKADGSVVRSVKDVKNGEQLVTKVKDGAFDVEVL